MVASCDRLVLAREWHDFAPTASSALPISDPWFVSEGTSRSDQSAERDRTSASGEEAGCVRSAIIRTGGRELVASGPAVHTGLSGTTSAVSRMAAVPAVDVKLGGPRARVLGFLVIASVFVVFWKWDSFSWHARGMILAAYGVVCLGAGLIPALRTRGLLESGAQAQGTVVDVEKDTSSGGSTTYNPVVRFTAADGRTVEFTSAVGYSRKPDIGGAVPVRYRPGDPEQAEIDRATMWMIPAAFGLVGGLGLLVAAVIVYSS